MNEIKNVITNLKNYGSNFDYQSYPLKKEEADVIISFYEEVTSATKEETEDIDAILTKDIDTFEAAAANFRNHIAEGQERINALQSQIEEFDNKLQDNFSIWN